MLRLGVADEVGILLVVIMLPRGKQFVAMAVAQLPQEKVGAVLNGAIPQRIRLDADGQAAERIALFRPRQHWSLIAQPPDVAKKSEHQHRRNADSNSDLYPSESHPERKFIWMATYGKITSGSTCTNGEERLSSDRRLVERDNLLQGTPNVLAPQIQEFGAQLEPPSCIFVAGPVLMAVHYKRERNVKPPSKGEG
jgi:hypothetical protein